MGKHTKKPICTVHAEMYVLHAHKLAFGFSEYNMHLSFKTAWSCASPLCVYLFLIDKIQDCR